MFILKTKIVMVTEQLENVLGINPETEQQDRESSIKHLSGFSQFFRVFLIMIWLTDSIQAATTMPIPTIRTALAGVIIAILWFTLGNIKVK